MLVPSNKLAFIYTIYKNIVEILLDVGKLCRKPMFLIDWVWNEIIAFKLLIVRPFTFLINVRSLV